MICLDVFLNENIKKAVGDGNMKEYEKIILIPNYNQ